jgi:hypothetical protein
MDLEKEKKMFPLYGIISLVKKVFFFFVFFFLATFSRTSSLINMENNIMLYLRKRPKAACNFYYNLFTIILFPWASWTVTEKLCVFSFKIEKKQPKQIEMNKTEK